MPLAVAPPAAAAGSPRLPVPTEPRAGRLRREWPFEQPADESKRHPYDRKLKGHKWDKTKEARQAAIQEKVRRLHKQIAVLVAANQQLVGEQASGKQGRLAAQWQLASPLHRTAADSCDAASCNLACPAAVGAGARCCCCLCQHPCPPLPLWRPQVKGADAKIEAHRAARRDYCKGEGRGRHLTQLNQPAGCRKVGLHTRRSRRDLRAAAWERGPPGA